VIGRSVVIVFVVISYRLFFVKFCDLFSNLMMEWNNDEISKLIDFTEKRSFMYPSNAAAASTMLSAIFPGAGARNCDELASNFRANSGNNFCYQFLVRVSPALVAFHATGSGN